MEERLQFLESVLGRLFPSGEMEAITRALLVDESPNDRLPPLDPMILDDILANDQSLSSQSDTDHHMDVETQHQSSVDTPESLVSSEEEREFLNNYFEYYHTLYPILHEGTFRLEYDSQSPSPYWPMLKKMVLAIGAWLTRNAFQDLDKKYFAQAQDLFQKITLKEKGDITLVQGLVLLSEFAQKQASPEESGHYIGTAVRTAVALHLHIEPSDPHLSELVREIRRRVCWSAYCSESCSAKIYGRPLLLPEDMLITVKPVSNIHESVRGSAILCSSKI